MELHATQKRKDNIFHLGLCMAGSVSAGAYIAGVVDYLVEALSNWEKAREDQDTLPGHQVVIDLMGGSSGGGITSALSFFALRDRMEHPVLGADRRTYSVDPQKNILWKLWVEMNEASKGDIIAQMLETSDIGLKYVPSGLNTNFVQDLNRMVKSFIDQLIERNGRHPIPIPDYLNPGAELFISLFNLTGIKYRLYSRGSTANGAEHYFSEHRDLAHFRWEENYGKKGRIPLHYNRLDSIHLMLDAAKATSAFPGGLRAMIMERPAKYIWDNPFFQQGKFNRETIDLGSGVTHEDHIYRSLHSDSGVANNEPVELSRDLLYMIQEDYYHDAPMGGDFAQKSDTVKAVAKSRLENTAVILIDPFPARDFKVEPPNDRSDNLIDWAGQAIDAMNSQLLFDAKQALDAYNKYDYGLSIIEPSKDNVIPGYALACGALSGFSGFLSKEFRVHDYFLGRHNCQSFLRKYFVADLNEPEGQPGYKCIANVIKGYRERPGAIERFGFIEKRKGVEKHWVPIIPDVSMQDQVRVHYDEQGQAIFSDVNPLPYYDLRPLPADFLEQYRPALRNRIYEVICNLADKGFLANLYIQAGAWLGRGRITSEALKAIKKDFVKRGLMRV